MEFVEWDETLQWRLVDEADVVLIPSDASDPAKAVKSANRLTDALHAGRYVIASPIPSYLPYADHAALTDNPVQALHTYMKDPAAARTRIARGQSAVVAEWSPEQVAGLWVRAIDQARASRVTTASPLSAPVRLNLGCGDKILPGYVNVDVVEARAGKRPDVLSDLRRLAAFADESADEVMAIHVVEHFWRWEVEAVLQEWLRVLKPGGTLVLECPDLQAACEAFLRDPETGSGQGPEAQTTMWVFYGDPAWKDPLMVHRWGYTPRSLSTLMESVGLVDVRREPAQFKRREPRDMRIVGRKPVAPPMQP
jgi:SAM-dependent methyltransferase